LPAEHRYGDRKAIVESEEWNGPSRNEDALKALNEVIEPEAKHGGARSKQVDTVSLKNPGGNSATYRGKKVMPDLAAQHSGEGGGLRLQNPIFSAA
jgi:hypothetical protein